MASGRVLAHRAKYSGNPYSGVGLNCVRYLYDLLAREMNPLSAQIGYTKSMECVVLREPDGGGLERDEDGVPLEYYSDQFEAYVKHQKRNRVVSYTSLKCPEPFVPLSDNDIRLRDHFPSKARLPSYIRMVRIYPKIQTKYGEMDDMSKSPLVCFTFTAPRAFGFSRTYKSLSRAIMARNRFVLFRTITPSDPKKTWPTLPLLRSKWYSCGTHPSWSSCPLIYSQVHRFFGELKWPETTD